MREIKFRGKDIESGEWFYGQFVDDCDSFSAYGYIVNGVIESNEEYINLEEWFPVKKETVGQFTGLLDKNGKEIYEGDIIRYNIGLHYPTSISSIEFLNGWFKRYKEGGTDILQYTENYGEIIGNIYENPELLEEETK